MERENDERVNQLFELRSEARYQFAQSVNISPQNIASTQQEEQLVDKLLKAIGQHMDDSDYTASQLAADVAMSRASLYKKMQTMLAITPNEFLRNVRLKHAAKLLAETSTPVNQVSLMVGFQTPRYFSQCFRQMFGVTPSEYRSGERAGDEG
jgi:transcriptional regulator GlxA family with amidase domain